MSFPISAVSLPAGQAFSCSPWSRSRPSLAERAYPQLLPVEPKPPAPWRSGPILSFFPWSRSRPSLAERAYPQLL
ncbi:MAG: hypothetical protein ACLRJD_03995, partial [[Clostridium] leptum]